MDQHLAAGMFEAKLTQGGKLFKRIVDSIKDIINDAQWVIQDSGISLEAMDNAHAALVCVLLKSECFDKFTCNRQLSLGINLASMNTIFKCAANEDTIHILTDTPDTITFQFTSHPSRVAKYVLKLMNLDIQNQSIVDITYNTTITMPSVEFHRIVKDLSIFGNTIEIQSAHDHFHFSCAGDIGSGQINIQQNDTTTITCNDNIKLSFSSKYLNMFTKAICLSPTVCLHIHPSAPLMIQYEIGNFGYIRYYLAAQINEQDIQD